MSYHAPPTILVLWPDVLGALAQERGAEGVLQAAFGVWPSQVYRHQTATVWVLLQSQVDVPLHVRLSVFPADDPAAVRVAAPVVEVVMAPGEVVAQSVCVVPQVAAAGRPHIPLNISVRARPARDRLRYGRAPGAGPPPLALNIAPHLLDVLRAAHLSARDMGPLSSAYRVMLGLREGELPPLDGVPPPRRHVLWRLTDLRADQQAAVRARLKALTVLDAAANITWQDWLDPLTSCFHDHGLALHPVEAAVLARAVAWPVAQKVTGITSRGPRWFGALCQAYARDPALDWRGGALPLDVPGLLDAALYDAAASAQDAWAATGLPPVAPFAPAYTHWPYPELLWHWLGGTYTPTPILLVLPLLLLGLLHSGPEAARLGAPLRAALARRSTADLPTMARFLAWLATHQA